MFRLLANRALAAVPIVIVLTFGTFALIRFSPIDPVVVQLGEFATEEALASRRAELGLDRSILFQYVDWLWHAVRGEFGNSIYTGQSVTLMIRQQLEVTLSLTILTAIVSATTGIAIGVFCASKRGTLLDRAVSGMTAVGLAIPSFWVGILFALVFGVTLSLLPAVGYVPFMSSVFGWMQSLILPVVAMSIYPAGVIARQTRGAMVDALNSTYVRALRSRGLRPSVINMRYALKNAMVPILTVIGLQFSHLIGTSFAIEKVFGMAGLGSLLIDSVMNNDFPVLQAVTLLIVLVVIVLNIAVDLVHSRIDPKVSIS